METVGVEPTSSSLQARCSSSLSYIPKRADEYEAAGLQPAAPMTTLRSPARGEGWPAGLEPAPAGLTTPDASVYTTATTNSGDDRTRTGAVSLDRRALFL